MDNKYEFKFKDKVQIKGGFYRGLVGTLEQYCGGTRYIVKLRFLNGQEIIEKSVDVHSDCMELIKED